MYKLFIFVIALILAGAGLYHYRFSPSALRGRQVQHVLDLLGEIADSQNRAELKAELGLLLTEHSQITLEIYFPSAPGQKPSPGSIEHFSKEEFITFVDNTLYSLNQYHFHGKLDSMALSPDKTSGTVQFYGIAEAQGMQMDNNMHFSGETGCEAEVLYKNNDAVVIDSLSCSIKLHFAPQ